MARGLGLAGVASSPAASSSVASAASCCGCAASSALPPYSTVTVAPYANPYEVCQSIPAHASWMKPMPAK